MARKSKKKETKDIEPIKPIMPAKKKQAPKQYYTRQMWKDVIPVFKCVECGHFMNSEDDMIVHVTTHVPWTQRYNLMSELIERKK